MIARVEAFYKSPSHIDKIFMPSLLSTIEYHRYLFLATISIKFTNDSWKSAKNIMKKKKMVSNDDNDVIIQFSVHTCDLRHEIFDCNSQGNFFDMMLLVVVGGKLLQLYSESTKIQFLRSTGFCPSV